MTLPGPGDFRVVDLDAGIVDQNADVERSLPVRRNQETGEARVLNILRGDRGAVAHGRRKQPGLAWNAATDDDAVLEAQLLVIIAAEYFDGVAGAGGIDGLRDGGENRPVADGERARLNDNRRRDPVRT